MEKLGAKRRDIQFFSKKNDRIICVHSRRARDFAKKLEKDGNIETYEAGRPLDEGFYQNVDPVGIRGSYFKTAWTSDFFVTFSDGRTGVFELVEREDLGKRAEVEKLELSRRYWATLDIGAWKVVLLGGDN